jgi:regulator of nucleoside diphosphate kinase
MQSTLLMTDLDQLRLRALARTLLAQRGNRTPADELQDLLDNAEVVPAAAIAPDVVTINSTIVCRGGPLGDTDRTITLVYPERADAAEGRISILSPLGRALLGARAGQTVDVETPGDGLRRVTVLEVRYQPETEGEWNR